MAVLGVGIIGFGKMGRIRAAALERVGGARVVSVYDSTPQDGHDLPFAANAEAVIDDPQVEAVFICTPNYLNFPLTVRALQAGKHVFCEKPPAFTAAEVEQIMAAEAASGRTLMYGFNHRHHAAVQHMKQELDNGSFGRVLWMRGRYGKSVDADFCTTWRSRKELAGGGILIDQGIHMLDLFLYLGGDFDEVSAMVSSLYWNTPGIEDNVFAIMRDSQSGRVASLHSTMTQWRHLFSLEVFLERGYMVLNGLKTSSNTYGEEVLTIARNRTVAPAATWEDEDRIQFPTDHSWDSEVEMFLDAIRRRGQPAIGNSQDALRTMQMIDRIYTNTRHTSQSLHSTLCGDAEFEQLD